VWICVFYVLLPRALLWLVWCCIRYGVSVDVCVWMWMYECECVSVVSSAPCVLLWVVMCCIRYDVCEDGCVSVDACV